MSWKELEDAAPELADFGVERFGTGVAYLATLRKDGSPRVHPVTPIIGQGRLFIFMEPTSPKGHDLRRDGRYAIHSEVSDTQGKSGEFVVAGRAKYVDDSATRSMARQLSSYAPQDRYILFELSVRSALSTIYEAGRPERRRWEAGQAE